MRKRTVRVKSAFATAVSSFLNDEHPIVVRIENGRYDEPCPNVVLHLNTHVAAHLCAQIVQALVAMQASLGKQIAEARNEGAK